MVQLRSRTRSVSEKADSEPHTPTPTKRRRKHRHSEDDDQDDIEDDNELNTTNRHFEMINDLPATIDPPNYNSVLTHPLTVKDTSVLYNSLIRSRHTWIYNYGNLFPLYWKKTFLEGGGEIESFSVKDKMMKVCDCEMEGGPHTFPVRLFILKDESIEQRWQESQDMKKQAKEMKKLDLLEEKKRKAELKAQKRLLKEQEKIAKKEAKLKARQQKEELLKLKKDEAKKLKEVTKREKQLAILRRKPEKPIIKPEAQSPADDSKMIANLNLLASKNPKLGVLMNKVAKGQADREEVGEFKRIIEVAKKMPAPPGWTDPKNKDEQKEEESSTEQVEKEEISIDETPTILTPTPNNAVPSEVSSTPTPSNTVPSEVSSTSTETTSIKTEDALVTPVKSKRGRRRKDAIVVKKEPDDGQPVVKKKPGRKPKIKDPNEVEEEKLTAFQLKYLDGATLMLEFLEEKYIRYYIPKNCVIEHIEEKDEFLVSWITIHNERDITRFAKRAKKPMDDEIYFVPGCPSPLFSTVTVNFKGIPKRFHPIVLNSPNKLEDVQRLMTQILEIGTRLSGYNLWYQLDGYDDADLAESLRIEANEYENKLKGRRAKRSSSVST